MTSDRYNLERYVAAQDAVFAQACAELAAGRKRTHWMWFIFPQLQGLGSSPTAGSYAIGSLEEARAYLAHPLLGERLRACTRLVSGVEGRSVEEIFGYPDHLKFHSCVTLFAYATLERAPPGEARPARPAAGAPGGGGVFSEALQRYFGGEEDPRTRELLTQAS
jgi:uncharacterized protein (DUF1810 family)